MKNPLPRLQMSDGFNEGFSTSAIEALSSSFSLRPVRQHAAIGGAR
jgi:hypothetical protein